MVDPYEAVVDSWMKEKGRGPAEAPGADPYEAVVDGYINDRQKRARFVFEKALAVNPDQAAQSKKLMNTTGLPLSVIERNLDEVKRKEQARMLDLVRMTQDSPVLARQIMDPTFTNQAHDDVKNLSALEQTFNAVRALPAGAATGMGTVISGMGEIIDIGARSIGLTTVSRAVKELTGADLGVVLDVAGGLKTVGGGWKLLGDAIGPAPEDKNFVTDVAGGIGQLLQQIGVQIATGGTASLVSLFSQGADVMADKTKGDKASQAVRDTAVLTGASITALTEKYGIDKLLNRVPPKIKNDALRWVADKLAAGGIEASQEIVEGVLQDVVRKVLTNSEAPIGDGALYEGSVAGTSAAIVRAALGVRARGAVEQQRVTEAEQSAERLQASFQAATATLLRERNPDEFRTLVQAMADNTEGAPKEVYVDAEVLNQLAPEVLAQLPQSVRDALPDALAANDVVAIPVGDVLTIAPGTPLEQVLIENARIGDPRAMSQVEAKQAGEKAQEFLAQEAQRVIQQATDQQAMQASSDRVRQGVLDQLNTVGRFRKEVNEGYATWTAAFYTTMAGRTGLTPEEMAAKYPLRIVGQSGQGETLKAGKVGEITVEGFQYSTADRATISTSAFGTGLAGSGRDTYLNAADQRLRKRAYFYVDTGTGINPESGVGGRAMKAQLSNIYDSNSDPLRLKTGRDQLGFESAVLDAGFSGYLDRMSGTQSGQVILLGDQNIPAEQLGAMGRTTGQVVPPAGAREAKGRDVIVDALNADKSLPSGSPTLASWQQLLAKNPEVLQALTDAGVFAGDQNRTAYKSNLIKAYEDATPAESYAQRAERPVPATVSAAADVSNARVIAASRQWPSNRDFKMALQAVVRAVTGKRDLREDTPENRAYIGRQMLKEAREALVTNSNAIGWYDEKVSIALAVASVVHPELATDQQARFAFTWALAVTSNGVKVDKNFEMANRAYGIWKASDADPAKRRMPTSGIGIGPTASKIHEALATYNNLSARWGYDKFKAFATTLQPNRQVKADFGRGVSGEGMDTMVYGAGVVGPKIGNGFFMNLYGEFGQLTMDRWWVRMWGRITGDLVEVDRDKIKASRESFVSLIEIVKADKAATRAVEQAIGTRLGKGNPTEMARAIIKATSAEDVRRALDAVLPATPEREAAAAAARGKLKDFVSIGDELRKAAKSYYGNLDGQIEVPGGSRRRDMMRAVSQGVLAELQKEHPTLTMADFQALMWYPEKTLYDTAGAQEQDSEGYDDDEAPDYANAAVALARQQGVPDDQINAAIERARSDIEARRLARGSGRAASGVQPPGGDGAGGDSNAAGQPTQGDVNGRLEQAGDGSGRGAGGNLTPLEGAPSVPGFQGPDPRIVAVAEQYARDNGIDLKRQAEYVRVDPERATRIAAAYEAMQHNPQDPAVKEAYDNLIKQTLAQYRALEAAGFKFWFIDFNQPSNAQYASSPWNAMRDMRANQQMGVFPTNDGFGSGDFSPEANPLLADTGLQWPVGGPDGPLQPVLANDLFRAVHDAFGHGMEGAGFRADGEENAWQAHSRLFTGSAVGAITSETRGQNSWLNYGPNGESNRTAKVEDTVFADQKTGLMPEWTWSEGRAGDMAPEQPLAQGPRGTFSPRNLELALNENADLSTFLHETGHFFLEVMADLASQPGAPADIATDMAALLKWFGVADLATWNALPLDGKRPYHERFAESFEQYLMEGKAPSLELQPLFRKFKSWMLNVYKSLKAFVDGRTGETQIQLSDEIRQVFDRMLANEAQIAEANEVAGMLPNEEADAEALEKLTARSLRDLKWTVNARAREIKKLQAQAKAQRKEVEAEVTAEVNEMPVYLAMDARERALQAFAEDPVAVDAGLDSIATQYGYTSLDQMMREIENAQPKKDVIQGITDQRMLEQYGDLIDQRAIEEAANEAVHNEARARSLATELKSQAEMLNPRTDTGQVNAQGSRITVNALVEAAKQFAANVVARTKIIDLKAKARQHTAAERRAGKRWAEATAKGETQEAVKAKQDQMLNNAAAKAALEAADSMRKMLEYVKKFEKESVRKKLPPEYVDQIDKLLERVDLRVSTTGRDIDRRASLAKWIDSQHALGLDPILPARLLEDIQLNSYKEMTVDEFTDLTDTIKNIEHLGRLKSKLLAAKDKREFDIIAEEIAQSIIANGGTALPTRLEPDGRISQFFKGAWADHRKLNSLVHQMDGGVDNGPFYRAFVRSMNEAGANENVMLEKATEALAKIYAPIEKLPGGISGGKLFIPEIRNSLSRAGRLSVALNWGNPQNRQRVMDGDNWTEAQVGAILKTLTPVELQFVNKIWEHIDSYWPAVKAKQLRVSGVVEDKVEAVPFEAVAADGTVVQMRGGYYPIKYDGDRSIKADLNEAKERASEIMRGAVARPTTRRGHTQERQDEVVGRPVKKDLSVITQHVNQVVHDLAWHEWFIDANRLLNDSRIQGAIRDHYGPEIARTMMDNVNAIAVGDANRQGQIDKLLLLMRANVTRSIMGASLTTALLQPFGLTQSMARIGVVPVLKGAGRWAGDAMHMENTVAWINEKSDFMRLRSKTFNRELREISQRVQGKGKFMQVADASLFFLMQKLQMVADVPTWLGQYEKSLAGGVDEATAVALADEAVLASQGGGTTKDLAAVQRNMPFLTQFYSYFSTTLQLVAEKTALTDFKNPRAVAGWLGDMALLTVIPAILPALITFLLKGGGEDDEPEDWAKRLAEWQASYLLGMFVGLRELPTLWSPFDYGGPPAAKVLNDGKRLVQQAGQGEIDDPAVIATIGFMGTALGIPTTQIIRSYKGWLAWDEGDAPATSILFGPPPKN